MKRLHITGCPRSGTTLLLEMAANCFDHNGRCAHEMSIFEAAGNRGDLFISKQPNDIRQLRHIFHRDPNLYVIYLTRDPRGVITSVHREHPGQYFCNYRVWRECDRAAGRYRDHPRFLQLRYEDLVSSPDAAQSSITRSFPFLYTRHLFSDYHLYAKPSAASEQAMHGIRQVSGDSLQKWRRHLPRLAEQYHRHPEMARDLVRLAYEPDQRWLKILDGVTGVAYPCRYSERRRRLREWEQALRVYLKSRLYLRRLAA